MAIAGLEILIRLSTAVQRDFEGGLSVEEISTKYEIEADLVEFLVSASDR